MIIVRNTKSTLDIHLILNRKREEASLKAEEMASHLEDKILSLKVNDTIFHLIFFG
jgi:hypothetical protein